MQILTEHDDLADPPISKVKLRNHQLTLLQACRQHEKGMHKLNNSDTILTKFGIIGDAVGSGKSYVILSLVSEDIKHDNPYILKSYGVHNLFHLQTAKKEHIKCNLVIIPHNIIPQWEYYIEEFGSKLCTRFIKRRAHAETLQQEDLENLDVLFVSNTQYVNITRNIHVMTNIFSRVIYDEADNLLMPACKKVDAIFYWFISASYKNFLHPNGDYTFDSVKGVYALNARGLRASGFIRDLFTSLSKQNGYVSSMILKNDDAYVNTSLMLPDIENHTVICETPCTINILNGMVNINIIKCINAHDFKRAKEFINPTQKGTEENIINMVIDMYNKMIHNSILRLECATNMQYSNEHDRIKKISSLQEEKQKVEEKIRNIKNRIIESKICPICYDIFDDNEKVIAPCCNNTFCFKCLSKWIVKKHECPLCKSSLDIHKVLLIDNAARIDNAKPKIKTKIESAIGIIEKTCGPRRFLILSEYDGIFDDLESRLRVEKINYAFLKGQCSTINKVLQEFRNETINVLLVNPKYYGCGLNLEFTTDIILFHKLDVEMEKQIIGRAQRSGRTSSLRVWHLIHDNEK